MKLKFLLRNLGKDFLFCLAISLGLYWFVFFKKDVSMIVNDHDVTFLFYFGLCFIMTILYFSIDSFYFIKRNKTQNKKELYLREVPRDYSPSMVSVLMNLKLEYSKDIVADLLFLEQKGHLKIQTPSNQIFLLEKDPSFKSYEKHLEKIIEYVMTKESITVEQITSIKENREFAVAYQTAVYTDLADLGLLTSAPLFTKAPFLLIIPCAIFVFMFFFLGLRGADITLMIRFLLALIVSVVSSLSLGFMIGILSLIFFFVHLGMGRNYARTEKGKEDVVLWFSYYDFLKDFSALGERQLGEKELWGYYFAYGLSLGLSTQVIEKFSLHTEEKMIR